MCADVNIDRTALEGKGGICTTEPHALGVEITLTQICIFAISITESDCTIDVENTALVKGYSAVRSSDALN